MSATNLPTDGYLIGTRLDASRDTLWPASAALWPASDEANLPIHKTFGIPLNRVMGL